MAVTFTNNWKNILDKLESVIETEFKGALPVYKGNSIPKGVNQALQLIPTSSVLSTYNATSETREFTIEVRFIFNEANVNETALDHILRQVSRIEALIHDNVAMSYTNENSQTENVFNCRFNSTELNADEESGIYVVIWDYKCQHLGNLG
tara:strand:- start:679 stop:1128 length:450 start_codon:yes stop_codon:yes gene_type:complete